MILRLALIAAVLELCVIHQGTFGAVRFKDNFMQPKLIVKSKGNIEVSAKGPNTLVINVKKGNLPKIRRGNFVVRNNLIPSEDGPNAKRQYIIKCCGLASICNSNWMMKGPWKSNNKTSSTKFKKPEGSIGLSEDKVQESGDTVKVPTAPGETITEGNGQKTTEPGGGAAPADSGGEGDKGIGGGEEGGGGGAKPETAAPESEATLAEMTPAEKPAETSTETPTEKPAEISTDTPAETSTEKPAEASALVSAETTLPEGSSSTALPAEKEESTTTDTSSPGTSSSASSSEQASSGATSSAATTATCPNQACPNLPCEPNQSLMMAASAGMLPPALGALSDACGKQYVIGSKQGAPNDAISACCSLGKKLASMEAAAEIKCLSDFMTANSIDAASKFWLSGVDVGCSGGYMWCSLGTPFDKNEKPWITNEPTSKSPTQSNCVAAFLGTPNYGLSVESCDSQFGFLCE